MKVKDQIGYALNARAVETPAFEVRLFGPFEAKVNGEVLPRLRSRKGQWLLALLALRGGRPVERAWLAGTLWPETTEENALVSLRQTLTDLRRALGRESVRITSPTTRTLAFDAAGAFVDVLAFDAALRLGDPASLERAVALQERPLLEDCLEEWALSERESRSQGCLSALQSLASAAISQEQFAVAVMHLRRIIAADPYHEVAQRDLMTALARSGDWGTMLLAYRDLRLRLQQELRAEPAAETRALYQKLRAEAGGIPGEAAATRKKAAPAGLLPRPLTELVGREQETSEVSALLFKSRLITLTGPGGVGKTRLAIRVAESWAEDQPDGVWFVDLAPLTDATLVPRSVAAVLGVREEPSVSESDTLTAFLRDRRLLLILDNCEHLINACVVLASRLLDECPALRLLTTSRQPLGLTGEAVWAVPSLAVPDLKGMTPDSAADTDAVRLFVERAASVLKGFTLTAQNAPAVARVCRRLDGMPLAIELAAARVRMLSPEQIAARLDDRFRLLTHGSRTALPRQQTLRAAVDWSYDLLSASERLLLARLSVFAGGWPLEAAEAVCVPDDQGDDVLDLLTALEEKSLVSVEVGDGPTRRYRLLETFRQYAGERLREAGLMAETRRRHCAWALALAEAVEIHCRGPRAGAGWDRLEVDHDNLRAALEEDSEENSDGEEIVRLRLAAALWRFWMDRGHYREGLERLTRALARSGIAAPDAIRNKALNGAAALAWHQGDLASARRWMEESVVLSRRSGGQGNLDSCLNNLGNVLYSQGEYTTARSNWEESLTIRRADGNQNGVAASLNNLGSLAYNEGDCPQSRALHLEALSLAVESGNGQGRQAALAGLGSVARAAGDYVSARSYLEDSLAAAQALGDTDGIGGCLLDQGWLALSEGNFEGAETKLRAALEVAHGASLAPLALNALDGLSELALALGHSDRAAWLAAAGEAQRTARRLPRMLAAQRSHGAHLDRLQAILGDKAASAPKVKASSFTWEETVALALELD